MVQNKFKPVRTDSSKIKSKNGKFFSTFFDGNGKTYSYDEIRKFAQTYSNKLKKINNNRGEIQITLKFDNQEYRSAGMTKQGENVKMWSPEDYDIDVEDWANITGFILVYTLI